MRALPILVVSDNNPDSTLPRNRKSPPDPRSAFIFPRRPIFSLPKRYIVVTYLHLVPKESSVKVIASRQFNQDVTTAKRAARIEPVFITDRGRPTHVLIGIEAWRRLSGPAETIVDLLAMAEPAELDLEGAGATHAWDRNEIGT
jgi:prevent-host-death family protein